MKVRRRFLWALLASLALHLGVLSRPPWSLGTLWPAEESEPAGRLEAHLAPPPAAAPAERASRPKPRRPAVPRPGGKPAPAPEAAPAVEASPPAQPEPAAEPVAPAEPVEPVKTASAAEIPLPRRLRIHYRVTLGEAGFVVGEAEQVLQHDGLGYTLRSMARTTGLAGFFKPAKVVNVSEGEILDGGLRPREFRIERDGQAAEWARFDWSGGRVVLSNQREFELGTGTQDMLSMFCQLALLRIEPPTVSVPVVTGKKVERYEFQVLGEETLATPRGERLTVHLRTGAATGKEATDVWLALDDGRLPVKIRHVDRRGDMFEQIADRIERDEELNGLSEGTR